MRCASLDNDEALDKADATPYDRFLIDINLSTSPAGVDVIEALRGDPRYAAAPMVACTAYAMPGDEEQFLRVGFDAYLPSRFGKMSCSTS